MRRSTRNERTIDAAAADVWALLADGERYDEFVVGAKRIRHADGDWPSVGASLHHTIGAGPFVLRDSTTVKDVEPGRRLELLARMSIAGAELVRFVVEPLDARSTRLVIEEGPVRGLAAWTWNPLLAALQRKRNATLLERAAELIEGHVRSG